MLVLDLMEANIHSNKSMPNIIKPTGTVYVSEVSIFDFVLGSRFAKSFN